MNTTSSPRSRLFRTKAALAAVALGGLCVGAAPQTTAPDSTVGPKTYPAYTAPSQKRQQNFDVPGVVFEMAVKEGDVVKTGQLLARQNTAADEAHLRSLNLLADATALEIEAAGLQLEKDTIDLTRKEKMFKDKSISVGEVEEARVTVKIDALKQRSAKNNAEKAKADTEEEKARIEQKKLYSKIDGVVSEINTHEGELANNDTQHPTITIVKNDPLYVEVELPAELVTKIKAAGGQQSLQVQYVDEKEKGAWREAKIHFIRPEADPRSNTEHVQLEMANAEGRSSGLQVEVRMPTGGAQVGAAAANR